METKLERDPNCIFCKIADGIIPSDKVYEDEEALAFRDISAQAPVHVLIIPKKHYASVLELDDDALTAKLINVASKVARELGVDANGFRIVINTGADGGQTVSHIHIHMLGGRSLQWPPG